MKRNCERIKEKCRGNQFFWGGGKRHSIFDIYDYYILNNNKKYKFCYYINRQPKRTFYSLWAGRGGEAGLHELIISIIKSIKLSTSQEQVGGGEKSESPFS